VSQPSFAQPVRHNLLVPVLLAFLVLGLIIALLIRFTPDKTADLTITHTVVYPTHTVFKSESLLVGHDKSEDNLYVLTTLRIDDRLSLPLFLKDFTATLTLANGEQLTASAIEKDDFANLYTSFPELNPLSSEPLLRDTMIGPGQSAEGMILLRFPITKDLWDHRQTAFLNVDLYHQGTQSILIGRASETTPKSASPPAP
jgi:hypothetical protein